MDNWIKMPLMDDHLIYKVMGEWATDLKHHEWMTIWFIILYVNGQLNYLCILTSQVDNHLKVYDYLNNNTMDGWLFGDLKKVQLVYLTQTHFWNLFFL